MSRNGLNNFMYTIHTRQQHITIKMYLGFKTPPNALTTFRLWLLCIENDFLLYERLRMGLMKRV